jgi:hypothetical protein
MGFFMDGKQINHESMSFSDVMRVVQGCEPPVAADAATSSATGSASNGCELTSTEHSANAAAG